MRYKPYIDWLKVFDVLRNRHISQRQFQTLFGGNYYLSIAMPWRSYMQMAKCDFTKLVQEKLDKWDELAISDGLFVAFAPAPVSFLKNNLKKIPPKQDITLIIDTFPISSTSFMSCDRGTKPNNSVQVSKGSSLNSCCFYEIINCKVFLLNQKSCPFSW
jgi:hypothetical protein